MDSNELQMIFAQSEEACSRLSRSFNYTKKKEQNNFTVTFLNDRLKQSNEIIAKISRYHATLKAHYTLEQRGTLDYFKDKIYDKVLDDIDQIDLFFSNNIEKLILAAKPAEQVNPLVERIREDIKLPEIHIPIFSGDFTK